MKPLHTKEEWARRLIVPLYEEGYIQTPWNTKDPDKQKNGWTLKNKDWALWFFNMRPIGDSPKLFYNICTAMAEMIGSDEEVDLLIGVEMAGLPLVGALSTVLYSLGIHKRFGWTRPLPEKARLPLDALRILNGVEGDVAGYGQKDFMEARIKPGDRVAVLDDMATNLNSKIIARIILLWHVQRQRISNVSCNKIFYFLNRGKDNRAKGEQFAEVDEPALNPTKLAVDYILEFDQWLSELTKSMFPAEFEALIAYQKDPSQFQDKDVQRDILEAARKDRG